MDIDVIKKLIHKYEPGHASFITQALTGKRYYLNDTDVLHMDKDKKDEEGNPLRNADNRIPRNFHGLIVNQKATYAFTAPPLFDVGDTNSNKIIAECLGDEYALNCQTLCINAANTSIAWVHYWESVKGFEWAVVDSEQIIPIWSKNLKKELIGVFRVYKDIDETTGDDYTIYEYWTKDECQAFRRRTSDTLGDGLSYYDMFVDPNTSEEVAYYKHDFGRVPFIPFRNNNVGTNDLVNIKRLIDVYDKVFSGFINDLDDIQELIFVLSGYGGTDLKDFLNDLKKYKTIKVDSDIDGKPGVQTLSIEIPIEARNSVLETTRKAIFEQGQGYDPQPENFGNQSGEALKFMYSLLEMKVGLMEPQFRLGFAELVRAICQYKNIECKSIIQTWTRTSIKNDKELAEICRSSVGIVSKRTILKNHPLVEDTDKELQYLEQEAAAEDKDPYSKAFPDEDGDGGVVDEE